MPSHTPFFPPGTPITPQTLTKALRDSIAAASAAPPGTNLSAGMAGAAGIQDAPAPLPRLAIFQITTRWSTDLTQIPGVNDQSGASALYPQGYAYAQAKKVVYLTSGGWTAFNGTIGNYAASNDPIIETVWHPLGYQIDSVDGNRGCPAGLQIHGLFMPAAGTGQWVWCIFDESAGIWQVLQNFEDIVRVRLSQNWYSCGQAYGALLISATDIAPGSGSSSGLGQSYECLNFNTGYAISCYDPIGTIEEDPLSVYDLVQNQWYIPAGSTAYVKRMADANSWEPLRFGQSCVCLGSSSSSSSGSGSSSSSGSGSSSSSGIQCYPVGQLANVPNYNPAKTQVLGQVGGCLVWIDTTTCASSSSGL